MSKLMKNRNQFIFVFMFMRVISLSTKDKMYQFYEINLTYQNIEIYSQSSKTMKSIIKKFEISEIFIQNKFPSYFLLFKEMVCPKWYDN